MSAFCKWPVRFCQFALDFLYHSPLNHPNTMTVSVIDDSLRQRAAKFTHEFSKATYEMGEAQDFIRGLCHVFNLNHRRAVRFEERVKKLNGRSGRIDGFFPGQLLVEMKSTGADLDKAYIQATEYFTGLKDEEMPRHVLVSDFANLHLYDLDSKAPPLKIKLETFPKAIGHFQFLAGFEPIAVQQQAAINQRAAEKMAGLHDAMKATGYSGKDLETYLVRLLFCLFAEDTGLFDQQSAFDYYLTNHTKADGSDLHGALTALFDTLNRAKANRPQNLPEHLSEFPHINGALFKAPLSHCYFDENSRKTLLDCAKLDWSDISPAIFGSLFQAIMHFDDEAATGKAKKRREFGAHYTSEENILKVIRPLFLDNLYSQFKACGLSKQKLTAFQQHLAGLHFFDPACGCGNFLVIAYRELRLLELEVIDALWGGVPSLHLDIETLIRCNVHQFHGIEIDDSAVQIATLAMWLTDHQMNLKLQRFGLYYNRIPLIKKANIVCGNALRLDWAEVLPPEQCSFMMGNPPFVGSSYQTKDQKADCAHVFKNLKGAGVLDYVAAWHVTAARYIQANPSLPVAFVSTNSICQGEQVSILWGYLLAHGVKIQFAHRSFRWRNEGRGVAAVHCVIIGFGLKEPNSYRLFDYGDSGQGEPIEIRTTQINPYLIDAPAILIDRRRKPLNVHAPEMIKGNQPTDGGHLLLSTTEADKIRETDPVAAKYVRTILGAEEFIHNLQRYCLWLNDSTTQERRSSPEIQRRMEGVKTMRLSSSKIPTQKLAETPYLFGEIRQTDQPYLLIPRVSSETRRFVPIGYIDAQVICKDQAFMLPNATRYDFGLLTSSMHMAWMRAVCGRMKSDYNYSNTIVYNNYPWPENIKPEHHAKIEAAAQGVLDARSSEENRCNAQEQHYSLANLYAAGNMPSDLLKAHNALDKAVDKAYGYSGKSGDSARVAFLFERYQVLLERVSAF